MTKLRVFLLFCLSLIVPVAVFGNTLTGVLSTIETQLPTNTTGSITAAALRNVLDAIADYAGNGGTKIVQSGPYLLTSADCGNAMAFSGGFYAVTLPAVTGISSCMITIKNDDATRGKTLSGFPADLNTVLYPKQTATVKIVNGAWTTLGKPGLWRIQAATTFYINPATGSDANDGLATGSGAFATLQKAWNTVVSSVDTNTFNITLQAEDGTYTTGMRAGPSRPTGGGEITLQGNTATPTNVVIAPSVPSIGVQVAGPIMINVSGLYCNSANLTVCFYCDLGSTLQIVGNMRFGTSVIHMQSSGGTIFVNSSYSISGSATYHLFIAHSGSQLEYGTGTVVTLTGTPAFTFFVFAYANSTISALNGVTSFSGSATGTRYVASLNAVIDTSGGGANFFPGNSPGAVNTGGLYN